MGHWCHTNSAARVVYKENSKHAEEFGSGAEGSSEMWRETISLNISRKHTKWQKKLLNRYLAGIVGHHSWRCLKKIYKIRNNKEKCLHSF